MLPQSLKRKPWNAGTCGVQFSLIFYSSLHSLRPLTDNISYCNVFFRKLEDIHVNPGTHKGGGEH